MEKNFLIVANTKANNMPAYDFKIPENVEIAIAAPYPFIDAIPQNFSKAAQNVSSFPTGAYTGEVPAEILRAMGVKYCLIGHSERRKYLHETNDDVNLKFETLTKLKIVPIICAQTWEEIPEGIENCLVMYEPFSAISQQGKYNPESVDNIIRTLADWKTKLPENVKYLYGGSVNPENIRELTSGIRLLSGLVIGHASLDAQTFSSMINSITI